MYFVGSTAVKYWVPEWREPKDTDLIMTEWTYEDYKKYNHDTFVHEKKTRWGFSAFFTGRDPMDIEIAKDGNTTAQLMQILMDNPHLSKFDVVIPEVVYTMKMSHRYLKNSPHFKKCMNDIRELRSLGYGTIPDALQDWYKARMKATYNYGHPSLKQGKDAFFSDDGLNYVYDHDTIHQTVKTFSQPAFEMIKDDGAEVFCSKEKFYSVPEALRLATVLEESYTLALERSQIPYDFKPDPKASFKKALEKVCTSISSGWWREYAWENYETVLAMYNGNYVSMFKHGLANGVVKPYGQLQLRSEELFL